MQRPLSVRERPRKTDNLIKTGTAQGGFYKPFRGARVRGPSGRSCSKPQDTRHTLPRRRAMKTPRVLRVGAPPGWGRGRQRSAFATSTRWRTRSPGRYGGWRVTAARARRVQSRCAGAREGGCSHGTKHSTAMPGRPSRAQTQPKETGRTLSLIQAADTQQRPH